MISSALEKMAEDIMMGSKISSEVAKEMISSTQLIIYLMKMVL